MRIETSRLVLRKHEPKDFDRYWKMINDPIAKQYTGGVTQLNYEQRLKLFQEDCAIPFSDTSVEFAVIEKVTGTYIGYCGFRLSTELGGMEFFYGYCRDSWGQGYGFEAANAALQYFSHSFSHDCYIATTDCDNIASAKILKKLGFSRTKQLADVGNKSIDCYVINRCKI